jgi:hypothetical protein
MVKLDDVIEALTFQTDGGSSYLDRTTGNVVYVTDEDLRAVETHEPLEHFPEWQQETIKAAQELFERDDYLALPSQFDVHEYAMMEEFCVSLPDHKLQDSMCQAIRGKGAFQRFKTNIRRYNLLADWDTYRMDALREKVIDWCNDNNILYTE